MTIRNQHRRRWLAALLTLVSLSLNPKPRALAQILPDNTLGNEGSLVLPLNAQTEQIQGGALRGTNLFHSFRAFNIGEGRGAYFANPAAVENIFSRVTGSTPSRLFGTLGVLGEANLFFLNPNGILFGPNFSLDVRGSFVATTANSIALPDGSLFSASDPQAPPLLTVNVTAPIGLRFEGASPGTIVNAGNLTANEGQNLTLAAGTVASTGLLAAPGGEVAVVSVPGAGADGMPTVQLGEAGQFLDLALEPPPASGAAVAPAGVALPDLLAGEATTGLTVNAAGEVELAASGLAVAAGDVTVQQLSAGTATLSAAGNLTLVESQLGTTGDLQLLAKDTVRVRDSAANPFIAAAGGELLVQGDRSVDIFALNHGSSGLFSGGDMTLRSADTVNGDAHYWSGGSFQIEQLDGSSGGLSSPHDPIIRSLGDVSFDSYFGASLHIFAAGSVEIPGFIFITESDPFNGLIETVALSNGKTLLVDGQNQLTLDIRAGIDPAAVAGQSVIGGIFGTFFDPFPFPIPPASTFSDSVTSADIAVGDVLTDFVFGDGGRVLLTNQYQPNSSLAGDIAIASVETSDVFGGGSVAVDSRGNITLAGLLHSSAVGFLPETYDGNGGEVTFLASRDIHLLSNSAIVAEGLLGGPIVLASDADIVATNSTVSSKTFTATTGFKGGDITLSAKQLLFQDGAQISAFTFGTGAGGNLTIDASESAQFIGTAANGKVSGLFAQSRGAGDVGALTVNAQQLLIRDGAQVSTNTLGDGTGGSLIANATEWLQLIGTSPNGQFPSGLFTDSEGKGDAGSLAISTRQLLVQDGAKVSTRTLNNGTGGSLMVDSAESVQLIGTSPDGRLSSGLFTDTAGKGNAGSLTLNTQQLLVRDGARVSTSTSEDGAGGTLTANVAGTVQLIGTTPNGQFPSGLFTQTEGRGDAGSLTIGTRQLLVRNGAQISSSTFGDGTGGSLVVDAADWVQLIGTSPDSQRISGLFSETKGKGNAGSLIVGTRQLLVRNGAQISSSTFGDGTGGSLVVDAADWVQLIGTSPDSQRISGLFSETKGKGNAGSLIVGTRQLLVRDGALVSSSTLGDGAGGSLVVDAADWVQLIGTSPDGRTSSGLLAQTEGKGNAGSVAIDTQKLLVRDGALVSSSTLGDGAGENLFVDAAELVQLIGNSPDGRGSVLLTQTEGKGNAGSLTIDTRQLLVQDGAQVSSSTVGEGAGGRLIVNAVELVQLVGTALDEQFPSGLFTLTHGKSAAGNLIVSTQQLLVRDGAQISAGTFGDGAGGNLIANAVESVQLIGTSPSGQRSSGLSTQTQGKGAAGKLIIGTQKLLVRDGALISADTFGDGAGGSLIANATESVQLIGTSPGGQFPSGLFTDTTGKGAAGTLTLGTQKLLVQDGASVSAGTAGDGAGGILRVDASERVQLMGVSLDGQFSSGIFALTSGDGRAGDLNVTTGELIVQDGARASVSGTVSGDAGNLSVTARSIFLDNGSSIFAETASGQGGNITLNVADLLLLRRNSQISTTAGTAQAGGDGGNITIDAGFVVAVPGENSDIFANAFTGRGGNINITANGIFGLKFRPFLTEFSDITASSQFGVDGTVQLNTLGIDPSRGLGLLPTEPTTLQVAESCRTRGGRATVEFFDVGSGGLPPRPDEPLHSATLIADLIPLDDETEERVDAAVREAFVSPRLAETGAGADAVSFPWVFCQQVSASP